MDKTCKTLDKTCEMLRRTIEWASHVPEVPVAYIAEDRIRVATARRPLIEFGLHSSGSDAVVRVGGHRVVSTPGTLLVMNAHFGNTGVPRRAWGFWCLSFDVRRDAPWPDAGRRPFLAASRLHNPGSVIRCYEAVAREYAREGPGRAARLKGAVLVLLGEMLDDLEPGRGGPRRYSSAVENAIAFMLNELRNPDLSLAAVARRAGLSEDHFGRLFRAEVGTSPMRYLREARLQRARQLLDRTRLTVREIAYGVGFRDPAYFSRVFREHTGGLSPRRFRKRSPGGLSPP